VSTRASLYAKSGAKVKELAEAVGFVPVCWVALLSPADVDVVATEGSVTVDRTAAVDRCAAAVGFLAGLFPDVEFEAYANDLLALLRRTRAPQLIVVLNDLVAMDPESYPVALRAAVASVVRRDPACAFDRPPKTFPGMPGVKGSEFKQPGAKLRTTREVLGYCATTPMADDDDEDLTREKVRGAFLK